LGTQSSVEVELAEVKVVEVVVVVGVVAVFDTVLGVLVKVEVGLAHGSRVDTLEWCCMGYPTIRVDHGTLKLLNTLPLLSLATLSRPVVVLV